MVVNAALFETRGGAILGEFEPRSATWSWNGVDPETVDLTIDMADPAEEIRNWRNAASPWNHCIAVDIGGRWIGGPVLPHDFSDDDRSLKVTVRGFRILLSKRFVLPIAALTTPLTDPLGVPNSALNTVIGDVDYGTIGKKLVEQAAQWPGWTDIPIVYHADRPGNRFATYPALDFMKVDEALTNLSNLENGPDIRFELNRVGDYFQWQYRSGTALNPRLESEAVYAWEIGSASGISVQTNPMRMGSVAWSVAGRAADSALVRMRYDSSLIDFGGVLLEQTTDVSANATDPLTLDRWNTELLRTAKRPWEFWSFKVRADAAPFPYEYSPGDRVKVVITEADPAAGNYIAPGEYERRISQLSGDERGEFITITCGEVYDG